MAAKTPVNIINEVETSAKVFSLPTIPNIPTIDAVNRVQLIAYPTHRVHKNIVGSVPMLIFISITKYEITVIKLTSQGKSDLKFFRLKKKYNAAKEKITADIIRIVFIFQYYITVKKILNITSRLISYLTILNKESLHFVVIQKIESSSFELPPYIYLL